MSKCPIEIEEAKMKCNDMETQKSEFMSDLVDKLREKYNIPDDYYAYFSKHCVLHNIVWNSMKNNPVKRNFDKLNMEEDFHIFFDSGDSLFKHIDGSYVIFTITSIDDSYLFVFTKDINKFLENINKKSYIPLEPGTYQIVADPNPRISKFEIPHSETPILNNNLEEDLSTEITKFKENENLYKQNKIDYKRGILLYGKPGNGKTTFIRNFINKQKDTINIVVDCRSSYQVEHLVTVLRDKALEDKYKVIVMEDIDGICEEHRSQVLNLLDGVIPCNRTIFIATTNYPTKLDEGLTGRPSRIDAIYKIDDPDEKSRKDLIVKFFPNINDKDLNDVIKKTKGYRSSYFKEIYLLSQLHNIDIHQAIKTLDDRFKDFKEFTMKDEGDYLG